MDKISQNKNKNNAKTGLFILSLTLFAIAESVFGQAKKPTLMILPSDNWCEQRYFMTEFDNQGTKIKIPNYKQVFQEDTEIGQVISKIGSLMVDHHFPLKDVEQELKSIEERNAENEITTSTTSGASLVESPLDKLKNKAKADILIQIWWKVTKTENDTYVLKVQLSCDDKTDYILENLNTAKTTSTNSSASDNSNTHEVTKNNSEDDAEDIIDSNANFNNDICLALVK